MESVGCFGGEGFSGVLAILLDEDFDFLFHFVELGRAPFDEAGPFLEEGDHVIKAGFAGFHVPDDGFESGKVVLKAWAGFGSGGWFGFAHEAPG